MANSGWIKLHRKIQDCLIWNDEGDPFDRRSAWIDLLLSVNHSDSTIMFDGHPVTVKAGQKITSIRILANRWHWSKDRVKRYLDLLERDGMIARDSDSRRTLLTIVNYRLYQGSRDSNKDSNKDSSKDTNKSQTRMFNNDSNNIMPMRKKNSFQNMSEQNYDIPALEEQLLSEPIGE